MGKQQRHKHSGVLSAESDGNSRKLWVVAVIAFWISAGITLTAMVITGKLDLILISITLGLMVLGVWLKARYQLHQRKTNRRMSEDDSV